MQITYEVPNFAEHHYQDKAPIRKCARPWAMVHDEAVKKAVLLCHGYTGYPGELIRPGTDLFEAGFDVYCPRYPGHGTSGKDFLSSKAEDWIGTAYDAFAYLAQRYEHVSLVGHSMGGAIATIIADAFDADTLALLAPALVIPSLPATQVRILRHVVKRKKVAWKADLEYHFHYEGDADDDAFLGSEYWSYQFPKGIWELERVRRRAVASIDHVLADTLSISGGLDPTIPEEASVLVTSKPKGVNKHLHIKTIGHLMPYDKNIDAQNEAMAAVVAWMQGKR
ncbi:alpha/beta hydrolase [Sphaerochaeta globosa]|uniref:Alpha/beta hydrolase fold protein n=1 Tax=Sphaerochaeta globosa (strain ATCC BAA-1886 / DSM 22777 / Buddy) TaxID=158189 RepID=F0RWZ6_SPHGB|nr:alpha/beta fold hydrolase [Sphaerochaeta globosa]ADY13777.1 alpha/beta hydrolase fold protein [Sphaerochaeta globosa str. Buddy]